MNKQVKTKNVALIIALNEIAWYVKDETQEKMKKLPLSYQFIINGFLPMNIANLRRLFRMARKLTEGKSKMNILRNTKMK